MSDSTVLRTGNAEVLTGRVAEYQELLDVLTERPGLTILSADPWSGTSALLATAVNELGGAALVVDARGCNSSLDLAMAIADRAVSTFIPDAASWWTNGASPAGAASLRLSRTLNEKGIELDGLRLGVAPGERRLSEAIELLLALAAGDVMLAIDHFGLMLSALSGHDARQLLGELRAARQAHTDLDVVLVEHPDGLAGAALANSAHPLYRAGMVLRIRRANARRFVDDLAITRPWTDVRAELLGAAAELAAGVPTLTWRVVDLAPSTGEDEHARALAGWRSLQRMTGITTGRQWDSLRRVHPVAQAVVAAISVGLRPHAVAANSKSVNDALGRLRELGMAWQPERRRWALSDPLLEAWVGDHAPPWTAHRRA